MPDETTDLSADIGQALSDLMQSHEEAPEAAEETTESESLHTNQSEEAEVEAQEAETPAMEEETAEEPQDNQGETPEPSGQSEEEAFTKLKPEDLPAEALPYYKSMQAEFTRKNTEMAKEKAEVASYRNVADHYAPQLQKLFGEVQGVQSSSDMAAFALQQMVSLYTDEQVQVQTYQELQQHLAQLGLIQEATPQAAEAEGETPANPALPQNLQQLLEQQLRPLQQTVEQQQQYLAQQAYERNAYIQQQEQQQHLESVASEFSGRLDACKSSPEFKDLNEETWDIVRELGIDMNGDFLAAAKMAKKAVEAETSKYLQQKTKQPKVGAGGEGSPAAIATEAPKTTAEAKEMMMAAALSAFDQES